MISQTKLDELTANIIDNKNIFGTVFCVENEDASISYTSAAGNIKTDDYYFIASVTKLYVTAIVLILKNQGHISFSQKAHSFFPEGMLDGIHVYKGKDYSREITIQHLISNTSGLPDYFFGKGADGKGAGDGFLKGQDEEWSLEKTIEFVKGMKPRFYPGQPGKAVYSDTNYQILGVIIEKITGLSVAEAFQKYLFDPLGLKQTYVYSDIKDTRPVPMYYRSQSLYVPRYMASVPAEGGIAATAKDSMVFLKAFFNNFYFAKEEIEDLKKWNFMLMPATMYFGIGLEKLWIPRMMSPLKPIDNVYGFWGQTGAFAFYHADSGLYFTGTANQINGRGHNKVFKIMLKLMKS